ncbi:MAG: NDP-sugar synthase [Bacteroidota bacterium]
MKAGIIAAGEGSRLRAEGIRVPKPLVVVDGLTLIERLLNSFIRCGIEEVACIINANSLEVKKFVEAKNFKIPIRFHIETTPSSMHSFFALEPYFHNERFLLTTVDSIFDDADLIKYLRFAEEHPEKDGILAVTNFIDDETPLYVQLDSANKILRFGSEDTKELPEWVTGGLYILSTKVYDEKPKTLSIGMERFRNFLRYLLEHSYSLTAFPFSKIIDVDHINDVRTAEQLLRARV